MFILRAFLSTRCHVALVRVLAVADGLLDVQPMVNQLDADGNAIPHGQINGIPFMTLQAGGNAVLMTPEVGDNGVCLFADRDISSVKANRDISNPGSMRQCDMADGLYVGGFLNGDATQFIEFTPEGIRIKSPTAIKLEAPEISMDASGSVTITTPTFTVNGASQFNGNMNVDGTIDATGIITAPDVISGGKSGKTHYHIAQGATAPTTDPKP